MKRALPVFAMLAYFAISGQCAEPTGPISDDALAILIKQLNEGKADDRETAAFTLGCLRAKTAVPALAKVLTEKKLEPDLERQVAKALRRIGPDAEAAVPELVQALKRNSEGRAHIAGALWHIAKHRDAIPTLIDVARNDNDRELFWAARELADIGPEAKAAVPALTAHVKGCSWDGKVFGTGPKARDSYNEGVRLVWASCEAVKALGKIGPEAKTSVPELVKVLTFKDIAREVLCPRVYAAEALWRIEKDPDRLKFLEAILKDEDTQAREQAALALARIGPDAKATAPALVEALKDKEALVRLAAAEALCRFQKNSDRLAVLIDCLKDKRSRGDAYFAALALGRIGEDAEAAVPALVAALEQQDDSALRRAAVKALHGIGTGANDAVPSLVKALKHDGSSWDESVIETLAIIDPGALAKALAK